MVTPWREKVGGLSPSLSKGEGASGIVVLEVTMALFSLMTYSVFSPFIIIQDLPLGVSSFKDAW